jgi:hypothetical protein
LKKIRPVYATTKDGELERLFREAEQYFHQEEP